MLKMEPTQDAKDAIQDLLKEYDDDTMAMAADYYNSGICLNCGDVIDQVEPDAENYRCLNCNSHAVMGIEQALLTHFI